MFENLLVGAMFGAAEHVGGRGQRPLRRIARPHGAAGQGQPPRRVADPARPQAARTGPRARHRPELLLLDEIAGGLTEAEAHELVELDQRRSAPQGVTIVWIEHVVHALLAVASRLLVINFGAKLADGEPRSVMASREVRRVYMGIEA